MTMIERVARAIHAVLSGLEPGEAISAFDTLDSGERGRYADAARHAIATMRSPSDAMLAEGNRRDLPGDAANRWERMVYRALTEDDRSAG